MRRMKIMFYGGGKGQGSETKLPEFKPWLWHFLIIWLVKLINLSEAQFSYL